MVSRDQLESKTVTQLKGICKTASIRGYSKLKKSELIDLILSNPEKVGDITLDSGSKSGSQPKVKTTKVYSRDESEKKIEKNKKLMQQRADVAGVTVKELKHIDKTKPKTPKSKKTTKNQTASSTKLKGTIKTSSKKTTTRKKKKQEKVIEKKEERFQDLPHSEQRYILKTKISGSVLKILHMNERDFIKQSKKKLDKLEDILSLEQSKLTPYQPTDKLLRNFIQESIDLIRHAREEQLNMEEKKYFETVFPKIVSKNSKKIKKIMEKLDHRVYTEMDIAREIVEKINFKPPFSDAYLATKVKERLISESLIVDS